MLCFNPATPVAFLCKGDFMNKLQKGFTLIEL
ncbi:MAG: hypothetical protein RugAbin2_00734, partial [Rugosibacter sp.]|nr:hypothetical protein [Rugosibacter sp.]